MCITHHTVHSYTHPVRAAHGSPTTRLDPFSFHLARWKLELSGAFVVDDEHMHESVGQNKQFEGTNSSSLTP
jgi:hypothetical protein